VKRLQQEYDSLRAEVNSTTIKSNPKWLAKKKQMIELSKQLMAARENARNDIYERVNSCGSMGISFCDQITTVDLHGLDIEGAKQIVRDTILPVVSVLKEIMVITGRGVHNQSGESGVLKQAIKSYLGELQVKFEDAKENDGILNVFA
jgi:DNA-nicking Smr family endonuclease